MKIVFARPLLIPHEKQLRRARSAWWTMLLLTTVASALTPQRSQSQGSGPYHLGWSTVGGGGLYSGGSLNLRLISTVAPLGPTEGGTFKMTLDAPPAAPGLLVLTGRIIYGRHTLPNGTIWLFDQQSGGETKITDGARARLSPGGAYLVFLRDGNPYTSRGNVYLRDLLQGTEGFFFPQSDFVTGVSFSGDGNRVVFDHSCGIYAKSLEGSNAVSVVPDGACYDDAPAADPVTGRVAFHNVQRGQIGLASADGSAKTYIDASPVDEAWPCWSPDGQWIAATAGEFYPSQQGPANLIKVRPDGTGFAWLTSVTNAGQGFLDGFAWTADGQAILAAGVVNGAAGLFVVAADGRGILANLLVPPGDPVDWIVSADVRLEDLVAKVSVTPAAGGKLYLSWPKGFSGYRLLSATDLVSTNWQPYGDPGTNSAVVDPRSGPSNLYFRLLRP